MRASELEAGCRTWGWEAENDAAILLSGLGLAEELHTKDVRT